VRTLSTLGRLGDIASLYARFWNPRVLFIDGAPWLMHSTGRAGVVLVAVAGVLIVGLVRLATRAARDPRALVVLGGFLLAPVPASLVDVNEHTALHATWRAVALVPFGALATGAGIDYLLSGTRGSLWRAAVAIAVAAPLALLLAYGDPLPHRRAMALALAGGGVVAIALMVRDLSRYVVPATAAVVAIVALAQFADFYVDYLTMYQQRFASETDGNMRDALEAVIDHAPTVEPGRQRAAPAVYLGFRLGAGDWGGYYWKFYVHKRHRADLLARTIDDTNASRFNEAWICHLPADSVLATPLRMDQPTDKLVDAMIKKGEVVFDGAVAPVHGRPTYWLLQTTGSCGAE